MKKILTAVIFSIAAIGLVGCTPGHNVPGATLAGATAGGLIGSQLFHGRGAFAGVVAGALVGGVVGDIIGRQMDKRDRANMENAIVNTPVDSEATWTNSKTKTTYVVRPVRNYHHRGRYCREYQTTVIIGGKKRSAYGKACRKPDGSWKIVK